MPPRYYSRPYKTWTPLQRRAYNKKSHYLQHHSSTAQNKRGLYMGKRIIDEDYYYTKRQLDDVRMALQKAPNKAVWDYLHGRKVVLEVDMANILKKQARYVKWSKEADS